MNEWAVDINQMSDDARQYIVDWRCARIDL